SRLIVYTGCDVSTSAERMRLPVTSMRSSVVASPACACATAGAAVPMAPAARASVIAARRPLGRTVIVNSEVWLGPARRAEAAGQVAGLYVFLTFAPVRA